MDSELDKIKGLEEAIQTYVARHERAKVMLKGTKLFHKNQEGICRDGLEFLVRITHPTVVEI